MATHDGSFFETAGTLERLIAGEVEAQQQADLAAWEAGGTAEPSPAPVPAQVAPEPAEQRDKLEDAKAALWAGAMDPAIGLVGRFTSCSPPYPQLRLATIGKNYRLI